MNPLIIPVIGQLLPLLFFDKDDLGINNQERLLNFE